MTGRPAPGARHPAPARSVLLLACFLSGAAGLFYEIAWMRKLALIFGQTSVGVSLVLALFMGGAALGSWFLGRASDSRPDASRFYALVELGVSLSGLLSAPLLAALTRDAGGSLPRGVLAGAAILVPSCLMGAALPALVRSSSAGEARSGADLGAFYAANTLGGALAALGVSLWLAEALGFDGLIVAAACLNGLAACAAMTAPRADGPALPGADGPALPGVDGPAPPGERRPSPHPWPGSLWAVAVAGFTALAGEVVWTRYLILVLGTNSVEAFGFMLTAVLISLVVGGAVGSRLADDPARSRRRLSYSLLLYGAATATTVPIMNVVAHFPGGRWAGLLKAVVVLAGPMVVSGAVLPLALAASCPARPVLGRSCGSLLAVNTAAAVSGSLAGGFLLLPWLGLKGAVAALSLLAGGGGLALGAFEAVPATMLLCSWLWLWNSQDAGRADIAGKKLIFYKDSPESTVAVGLGRKRDGLTLFVDWREQAGSHPRMQIHLRLLGHLPALLHPAPKTGLVVGLGAGVTAGCLARHPLEAIDVVELSGAVIEAAPLFAPFNHAPLADSRVRLIRGDGRNQLLRSGLEYDVITTDPVNPDTAGAGALYSVQYYELVRSRLRPGGVVCQWVPSHYRPEEYRLLLRSFLEVFPQASLWYAGDTTVLLGFRDAPAASWTELKGRFAAPEVASSLSEVGIPGPEGLLSLLLAGPEELKSLAGIGPLVTDDKPLIEYHGPRVAAARPSERETWELLGEAPRPSPAAVLAGSPPSPGTLAPGRRALKILFERRLKRRDRPNPAAPYQEQAGILEAHSRRYLDLLRELLSMRPAPVFLLLTGIDERQSAALLEALSWDQRGRPDLALEKLLALDFSDTLSAPEVKSLPHRMVDQVIVGAASDPGLLSVLLRVVPPERNRPRTPDRRLWRRWWSGARFHLAARAGRFAWSD